MNEQEKERKFKEVHEYWEKQGREHGTDPLATIKDHQFRLLEMEEIRNLLEPKDIVLDIGCGNGYQTFYYAEKVKKIVGLDYSESFIKSANRLKQVSTVKNKVEFHTADVLNFINIGETNEEYDKIICERLLINLPTYEDQEKAIMNMLEVLKPKGKLILSEVTQKGHDNLNELRKMFGLDKIKIHWHNLYIDENKFIPFLAKNFNILEIKRFGMYNFISKVIHPLLVQPKEPEFDAKINEVARIIGSKITNFRDASHQVTFVLEKK